jgi:hypothetical protein
LITLLEFRGIELSRFFANYVLGNLQHLCTEARTPECNGTHPDASAVLHGQLDGLRQVTELLRAQLEDVRADRDR